MTDVDVLEEQKEQDRRDAQAAERLAAVCHNLPAPKGIFSKRCPNDGRTLKTEQWRHRIGVPGGFGHQIITLFSCTCGYKYATVR
jgi:hypothetical protein